LHGGLSPVRHGRYSTIKSERLQKVLAEMQQDEDPLDLTPDVEMLRALFLDYVDRYEEFTTALLAWYESYELRRLPPSERMLMALQTVVTEYDIVLQESPEDAPKRSTEAVDDVRRLLDALRTPDTSRPRQILDISDAKNILSEVGRMVERVEKIRAANAISRPELNRIYQEMWRAVDALVEDDLVKRQIKDNWLRIAL
jgi:hypothetical protein